MSIRKLNCDSDLPINSEEIHALQTYKAECERGLLHETLWHGRMAQLRVLYDEGLKCHGSAWGKSPRDPSFNEDHDFDLRGRCRQCGQTREPV